MSERTPQPRPRLSANPAIPAQAGNNGKPYYQDDSVTIYHGDCREILPSLRGDSIVTDPPFKLSQSYMANVDADNLEAVASLKDAATLMLKTLNAGGVAVCFYDNRIMPFALDAMRRAGWQYLRTLAFYRRWGNAHQLFGWMSTTDPVLVFAKPGAKPVFYGPWQHDCYVRNQADPCDSGHPAQKPVAFLSHIVANVTAPSGLVIDPYCGGGSVLVAAKETARKAIGIEIEERYCEIAAERCAQEVLGLAS